MADEKESIEAPREALPALEAPAQTEAAEAPETEPPARGGGRGRVALVVAVLAVLAAAAAGGGAYYVWQQLQQLQQAQAAATQQARDASQASQSQVAALKAELDQRVAAIGEQQSALQQNQQQLQAALEQVRELAGREQNQWVAAEAEYLLLIANQRLRLQRDVNTAIAALTAADQRLRDLADPSLLDVREQIAREIASLKAVPQADVSGMALSLSGLGEQVPKLMVRAAKAHIAGPSSEASGQPAEDWRQALTMIGQQLKSLVVIRHRGEQVAPLISVEEERLIREVLRLRLEEARAALLQQRPALFQASLAAAGDWLQSRFDADDPAVTGMATQLAELRKADVRPALPDISASLHSLRTYLHEHAAAKRTTATKR